jgi:hypothetical protein
VSKKIIVEYFGFRGDGSTVKEAKLDAGRKIAALHVGHWLPELIEWRGEAALVYRTLDGWEYTFIQHDGGALRTRGIAIGDGTFAGTVRAARRHLVDIAWRFGDPVDLFPEWFKNSEDRRDIIGRREWQIRYRRLKAEGKSDGEAHQLASEISAPRDVRANASSEARELLVAF